MNQTAAIETPAAAEAKTRYVLSRVTSDRGGDLGSSYYSAYAIAVTPELRARVDEAYALVKANPWMESIHIHAHGFALPGSDYQDNTDYDLDGPIAERVESEDVVELDEAQFRELEKCCAWGVRGDTIEVNAYTDPMIHFHEKYDYEGFTSHCIHALEPTQMREEREARRAAWEAKNLAAQDEQA